MTMHQSVLAELEKRKGRWPEVAEATGISKRTIEKIARQEIKNPGVSHIETLNQYFKSELVA